MLFWPSTCLLISLPNVCEIVFKMIDRIVLKWPPYRRYLLPNKQMLLPMKTNIPFPFRIQSSRIGNITSRSPLIRCDNEKRSVHELRFRFHFCANVWKQTKTSTTCSHIWLTLMRALLLFCLMPANELNASRTEPHINDTIEMRYANSFDCSEIEPNIRALCGETYRRV